MTQTGLSGIMLGEYPQGEKMRMITAIAPTENKGLE
jgi:hypothetical protein